MTIHRIAAIVFALLGVAGVVLYQFEPNPAGAVMTGGVFFLAAMLWHLFPYED